MKTNASTFSGYLALSCIVFLMNSTGLHGQDKSPSYRDDYPMFNITLGEAGIFDNPSEPFRYGVEYRANSFTDFKIIPAFGASKTRGGATFIYTDFRYDYWMTEKWLLIPSFGLGIFDDSADIRLGNKLEFRSGLELAYRFHKRWRIGLAFFHLSNGGIADMNPGTEVLVGSLCIPLGEN